MVVAEFLEFRRGQGRTCWLSVRGMVPVLSYLRGAGRIPPARPQGWRECLIDEYARFLRDEQSLSVGRVRRCVEYAGLFLTGLSCTQGAPDLGIEPAGILAFVGAHVDDHARSTGTGMVSALRSLLRFLFLTGRVTTRLDRAVPPVAHSRYRDLPGPVDAVTVTALLDSCTADTPAGRRDHGILLILARLGLRRSEVAGMVLDDIDWRRGELVIRNTKGGHQDRLPLPADVGEAIACYLSGRPALQDRHVFLGLRAPHAPLTSAGVGAVVRQACRRAGVPVFGAHRLRHALATSMLAAGTPLTGIAQVLRHADISTTGIYARVDLPRLALVTCPWPGARHD